MRGTGAERPVRAMKSGKLDGAKGSRHPACPDGQPRAREEPSSHAKPFRISKWVVWEAYTRVKANHGAAVAANKLTGGTIYATGSTTVSADLDHDAVAIDAGHTVDGIRPTLLTTGTNALGSNAPTTSPDGTKIILFFSEVIGGVDRTKITVKSSTTTQATPVGSVSSGPRLEIRLASALTSADTAVTVELGADAVTDVAAVAPTSVTAAELSADFPESAFTSKRHTGSDDRPQVVVTFSKPVASFDRNTPSVSATGASGL